MANDNPDWAKQDVGRIDTLRGGSLSINSNSSVNFDAAFTSPLLYTLSGDVTAFNCSTAGCSVGIVGSPSGSYLRILDFVTPAASNLLYVYPFEVTWTSAINLLALLPGDTSYQLQVRSGPTVAQIIMAVTLYAGALT